jgi:hypothetical protein
VLLLAACAAAGGCPKPPSAPELPRGLAVSGDAEVMRALLARIGKPGGTALAAAAKRAAERLASCQWFDAEGAELGALVEAIRCRARGSAPAIAGLEKLRGEAPLAVSIDLGTARLAGAVTVGPDGSAHIAAELFPDAGSALPMPGANGPGPALFDEEALIHLRMRPERGLPLGDLIPPGSELERLVGIGKGFFSGLLLSGTIEVAVVAPPEGGTMPGIALALGVRSQSSAVEAIEGLIKDLLGRWSVRRSPFAVRGLEGACLLDLRVMPDFAPCYVAKEDALILGWNGATVERALKASSSAGARSADRHRARVDLLRIAEVDRQLARSSSIAAYGLSAVSAEAWKDGARYRLSIDLEAAR